MKNPRSTNSVKLLCFLDTQLWKVGPQVRYYIDFVTLQHLTNFIWLTDHKFFIAKLDIEQIGVLDYFGGVKHVTVEDYFKASPNSQNPANIKFDDVEVIEIKV